MSKIENKTFSFDPLGYYAILGVANNAGEEEIKQNYREQAKVLHPDRNPDENALEKFQKLSVAYDVLKDETSRLIYDLMAQAHPKESFPDINALKAYKNRSGEEDISVRALVLRQVTGKIIKFSDVENYEICNFKEAQTAVLLASVSNWVLGWWHPKAFIKNIKAIISNFKYPVSSKESFRVLVHNAVAYFLQENKQLAASSAIIALSYSDNQAKRVLENFIAFQNTKVSRPKAWTVLPLKLIQLIVPFILIAAVCLSFSSRYITDAELWAWLNSKEEINYYVSRYQPLDKAGAYGIQEWIGYVGVSSLRGSYFNVMGLPVQRLYKELKTL